MLNSDEQLRIAAERGFESSGRQRAVEQFMQEYFRHSSALAVDFTTLRGAASPAPTVFDRGDLRTVFRTGRTAFSAFQADQLDACAATLPATVRDSPESMLRVYKSAALYGTLPAAGIVDAIRKSISENTTANSPRSGQACFWTF